MLDCANPYVQKGQAFGCGQCLPCRINRRRIWTHRILLEAKEHKDNAFITLTYATEHLPADMSVDSLVLQKWLKRLRYYYEEYQRSLGITPIKFRYYACGEYGEDNKRPHYHAALFGFPCCERGRTFINSITKSCCPVCSLVQKSWDYGWSYVGRLEPGSAAYVAGYITKKMAKSDIPDGVRAPFARMSNRPGIGAGAMDDVGSALLMAGFKEQDVPTALLHGSASLPLGRYLRRRLRGRMGLDEKTPQSTMDAMAEQMSELREKAFKASRSFKSVITEENEGRRHKKAFWQRIRDQRRRTA